VVKDDDHGDNDDDNGKDTGYDIDDNKNNDDEYNDDNAVFVCCRWIFQTYGLMPEIFKSTLTMAVFSTP
jgi:hypothetical protein